MKTNFVLVDYENVTSPTLSLLKDEQFRVWIFLGPNNTKVKKEVVLAMQQMQDQMKIVDMGGSGSNALEIDSVIKALVKLSYLKVEGSKVQFTGL